MTTEDEQLRAEHPKVQGAGRAWCGLCLGESWPCITIRLLDHIAESERENVKLCAQNAKLVDENATVNRMFEDTDSAWCTTLDELARARETLAAIADTPMKDTMAIAEAWTILLRLTAKARAALGKASENVRPHLPAP